MRIYQTIQWTILALTVILWCVNWRFGIIGIFWWLWNMDMYESGCQSQVVDEYEADGYPEDGLRRMFKSWIVFAIMASVALYFMYQIEFRIPAH